MDVIKTFPREAQIEIIKRTASFGKSLNDHAKQDRLGKLLLDYFPDMSRIVFNEMNDRYSLSIELDKLASRMERIKWTI